MRVEYVDIYGASAIEGGVAVVIDVMRAFTVAAWALDRGAEQLVLVDDLDQAVALAATIPHSLLFKDGAPDERFDLHNSPRQLLDLDVGGRTIVQRTTAGTRAAVAARRADRIYCASFVCAAATARAVKSAKTTSVRFVVSGGLDADEDLACAEFIAQLLENQSVEPTPYIDRARRSAAAVELERGVLAGFTGVTTEDVQMCLDVDRFDFAMQAVASGAHLNLTTTDPANQE
jgi:2-phosphosulfolactate phosphatase